jgi:hypothetical protein
MATVARLLSTGNLQASSLDELSDLGGNAGVTTTGTFYCNEFVEGAVLDLPSSTPMRITNDKKILIYGSFDELTGFRANLYENIGGLAAYMNGFLSEYKNPDFYEYNLDGDATYVLDGGRDMYDGGNFTTPWLIAGTNYTGTSGSTASFPFRVSYANTVETIVDTSFKYASVSGYVQNGTTRPLTVIGTRTGTGDPIGWQKGGNSGADGGGLLATSFVYNGTVVNGFTVYSFIRQTYNASDPSHCDLYILLGHPGWDSSFGTINSFAQPVNQGGCGGFLYTSGSGVQNVLAIATLLSKNFGVQVTSADCKTVTDNIINRVQLYFGF